MNLPFLNLVHLLEERAHLHSDRTAFTFLAASDQAPAALTFGDLVIRARTIARHLREKTAPGDRVLLVFPGGFDYIVAFFASLYAGTIAVPAYPPRSHKNVPDQNMDRLRGIALDATPRLALTTASVAARMQGGDLGHLETLATDTLQPDATAAAPACEFSGDRVAYIQYTSGSTGQPRGVVISHGQLLANEEMIRRIAHQTAESVVVGWLPLYHDMGLIGQILQPIYNGGHCVMSTPMSFIQKPLRWLQAIHDFRGTTGIAPNFGYELCAERIAPEDAAGLDLTSWRQAFIGSEPVRADVMRAFAKRFAPAGFRAAAFYPCYGLAEATLAVSGTRETAEQYATLRLDPVVLAGGELREITNHEIPGESSLEVVSCGAAASEVEIRIIDPATGRDAGPGRVGEIWVRGPAVARGYWNRPEETAAVFGAVTVEGQGPYLRSGDLGFLRDGDLFVTGRTKELVILDGRNLYPHDLEAAAEASHAGFRGGASAAFAVEQGRGEELVLAMEVRREARKTPPGELRAAALGALSQRYGVRAREILLLRAGALPRTSSGKLQRLKTRHLYLAGELQTHRAES